jgi:hypothetical protein
MYKPDKSIENNDIISSIEDNDIFNSKILQIITESSGYPIKPIDGASRLDLLAKEVAQVDSNLSIGLIGVINKTDVFSYNKSNVIKYLTKDTYREIIKNA